MFGAKCLGQERNLITMLVQSIVPLVGTMFAMAAAAAGATDTASQASDGLVLPTSEQVAWQDMEIGMFIHYDMPVFAAGWDHRQYDKRPDASVFNPTHLSTDQWLEAARALGARYAVLTAKHGSGFMLWQTDLYPYGMKQSPFLGGKGDIVRDFVRSCKKAGVHPGLYAHMGCNGYLEVDNPGLVNRGRGGDPVKQARYARMCEQMVTELWSRYGKLTEIWFDGGVLDPEKGGPDIVPIVKKLQPKAIIFQGPVASIRWIGNEDGVAPDPCWATVDQTRDYNGPGIPDGARWLPGECDVPIRRSTWMWQPNTEDQLFSVDELMDRYYRSVGHNCNLLLNANPGPDGLIPDADMRRYREFGDEIRRRFGHPLAQTRGHGAVVALRLRQPHSIDHVIVQEDIAQGERVREYVVEGMAGGDWRKLCGGQSIGHKRIYRFDPVTVEQVRIRVLQSVCEPQIRNLSVFDVAGTPAAPVK